MHTNAMELRISVPWGMLAAKAYGDSCSPPVLLLHGVTDNAGTFDRIMPKFPSNFYYVCLDIPGHGQSSWFPAGFRLDFMEYVFAVNRAVRQLKWKSFILIAHSYGGVLAQLYAATFPDQVKKLVVLDSYGPIAVPMKKYLESIRKNHENILRYENKMNTSSRPSFTRDVGLEKIMNGRRTFLTKEAAIPIFERGTKKSKEGFQFTMDPRLSLMVHFGLPLTQDQLCEIYKNLVCPFLLVMSKDFHDFLGIGQPDVENETFIGIFRKFSKFHVVTVDGGHDFHNDNPESVASIISSFISDTKCSL